MNSDSQYSEILKEARLVQSTNSSFDEFSQDTKKKIKEGNYRLPLLGSQNLDQLVKETDPDLVAEVASEEPFPMMEKMNPLQDIDDLDADRVMPFLPCFAIINKQAKQPGLKRRTARVNDLFKTYATQNPLDLATNELDISNESVTPQCDLLYEPESDVTFSQKSIGSQNIPYIRKKTEFEKNNKKRMEKMCVPEQDRTDLNYFNVFELSDSQRSVEIADISVEEREEQEDKKDDDYQRPRDNNNCIINVSVFQTGKPTTDYCTNFEEGRGTILWTRFEKNVPFVLNWSKFVKGEKRLRIKFMQYRSNEPIEGVVLSNNDVRKCRKHVESETRMPQEAYFYMKNKNDTHADWRTTTSLSLKGQSTYCDVPANVALMEFDITFACREKCMEVEEKRKKKCLVFILEDMIGNEICHTFIEDVRIVGYPKRDFKEFLDKRMNGGDRKSHQYQLKTTTGTFSEVIHKPTMEMKVTPEKMVESREMKRKASSNLIYVPIAEEDRRLFFNFFSDISKRRRNEASSNNHPFFLQNEINTETTIEKWLETMELTYLSGFFKSRQIFTISQLIKSFEENTKIFERIGPSAEKRLLQNTFLNYYYVYKNTKLEQENSD